MKEFNNFIKDLEKLISYESVLSSPKENAPFGEQTAKALNFTLSLAESFGFKATNYDNYIGEIEWGENAYGNETGEIGIIGHIDVVPVGDGWDTPPFELTQKGDKFYGRGTSDDKAPTLLVLYALKELNDSGIIPKRKIRLFIGCNEETGWKDVEYFNSRYSFPEFGFSPDGNFPLSYAEKGVSVVKFYLEPFKNFSAVNGGTAINAVCDKVTAKTTDVVAFQADVMAKYGLTSSQNDTIISVGKSAHGSSPHLGKNAILPLLQYFNECGEDVKNVIDCLFLDKFNLSSLSNEQGKTTFSPNLIYEENGKVVIECDCRIPAPLTQRDIEEKIKQFNIPYEINEKHPPLLVPKNGWFVNSLLSSYNAVMNQNAKAEYMCGSTFARVFKYGCAFGMEFPEIDGHMHEANENISEYSLLKGYEIYKRAILDLVR